MGLLLGLVLITGGSFGAQVSETETINYNAPYYYDADYWYPGQPAGYMWVLDLTANPEHNATWELSVHAQVTNSAGAKYMKQFVFLVPPCYFMYHTHILEMTGMLSPGEHFADNAPVAVDHFWIVS